jgi:hypothetical protein
VDSTTEGQGKEERKERFPIAIMLEERMTVSRARVTRALAREERDSVDRWRSPACD